MTDASLAHSPSTGTTPTLFLLHFLGGSARTWDAVVEHLGTAVDCRGIDLPGFGGAAERDAHTVEAMASHVVALVRDAAPRRWFLAGHSMGAKVAAVVARRAEDGTAGLAGLAGLVLLAGSPPSPEPMDEGRRRDMRDWFAGDAAKTREEASNFVRMNVGAPLDEARHARAVDDLVRMNPVAWRAWLDHGSREDWSGIVGRLETPALIVAGSEDADLGAEAQARLVAPHFRHARSVTIAGAAHLLPVERAAEVADLIRSHLGIDGSQDLALQDATYRALIASDRVSARTRAVLLDRARRDDPDRAPEALAPDLFAILRAVVDRLVPQRSTGKIDLAARIDAGLARHESDGWRFAALPLDREAWSAGLATLDALARAEEGSAFTDLDGGRQDALLRRIGQSGDDRGAEAAPLSDAQMKLWFEDVRAMAVRLYVSHPATLARIGYSGIANGGDGPRKQGFVETRAGRPEAWEPVGILGARP